MSSLAIKAHIFDTSFFLLACNGELVICNNPIVTSNVDASLPIVPLSPRKNVDDIYVLPITNVC
jgi:hypothetical protein